MRYPEIQVEQMVEVPSIGGRSSTKNDVLLLLKLSRRVTTTLGEYSEK